MMVSQPHTAHFHLLHKIYKQDCPDRHTVPACSCPTELISFYLDPVILRWSCPCPLNIRDSFDALHQFQNFQFATPATSSLPFTSIPCQDGFRAVHFELTPSTTTLFRLAELILTLNNLSSNSTHFLQVRGVAMSTLTGPSYACLFV
eukprot:g29516.t1